ncbi:hypothetical protein D3C87_1745180 [compost metagenome]
MRILDLNGTKPVRVAKFAKKWAALGNQRPALWFQVLVESRNDNEKKLRKTRLYTCGNSGWGGFSWTCPYGDLRRANRLGQKSKLFDELNGSHRSEV